MLRTGCRHRWIHLLPLCVALAHTGLARADDTEPIRKRLRVEPGATCLTTAQLAAEVERLLGDARIADDFVIFVEGSATDPRTAQLRVVRQEGVVAQRSFDPGPARCSHLHAAVGLAIALAIKAAQEEERDRIRDWSVSGAALWTYRLLPQFAPGAELSVRRALGEHLLLRAGALGVVAFDTSLGQQAGTFDATLIAARIDGCGRMKLGSAVHAGACLGMLGGMLYAAGDEVADPTSSVVPWFALSGALDFEFELSKRWSLAVGLSGTLLLHRVQVGAVDTSGMRAASRELVRSAFAIGIGPVYYL